MRGLFLGMSTTRSVCVCMCTCVCAYVYACGLCGLVGVCVYVCLCLYVRAFEHVPADVDTAAAIHACMFAHLSMCQLMLTLLLQYIWGATRMHAQWGATRMHVQWGAMRMHVHKLTLPVVVLSIHLH